jgi:hypothetical protein
MAWDNGSFDVAIFGGAGGTVSLGSGITVNRMIFEAGTTYNFAGEAANQQLPFAGTNPTIETKASVTFGTSSGASKVTFAGTNGLTMTGAGGTSVSMATSNAQSLSGGMTFRNGVTFAPSVRSYTGPTNLLDPNNSLTFDGGHFTLAGFSGRNIDQTLGNATFNAPGAGTRLFVTTSGTNAATTTKLHLGTITGSNLTSPGAGGLLAGLGSLPVAGTTHAITMTTAPTAAGNNTYGLRVINEPYHAALRFLAGDAAAKEYASKEVRVGDRLLVSGKNCLLRPFLHSVIGAVYFDHHVITIDKQSNKIRIRKGEP